MSLDERALEQLIEQSEDLHSDAMRTTKESWDELVELGSERRQTEPDPEETRSFAGHRRRLMSGGLMGAAAVATGAFGVAVLALMESPAYADSPPDVQMLQTSASIENLAVATYGKALTLPFIGGKDAVPVVKAFVTTTRHQHVEHAAAFNAAAKQLGGKAQTKPDPALTSVVSVADLTTAAGVVKLAIELENTAAQTYVANTAALTDKSARAVTSSIMGVEAQHASVLYAVQALLAADMGGAIALPPPDLAALPAAAGSVGFPDSFFKTDAARPAAEGAVQ
jgi:Ferritin-like domain